MKKVLFIIGLVVIASGSVFGQDAPGYYDGDPNQNEILEATEDYIVIRNITAKAKIQDGDFKKSAQVFEEEAKSHCSKNQKYKYISWLHESRVFDDHTAYYFCVLNYYDEIKKEYSLETEDSVYIAVLQFCLNGFYDMLECLNPNTFNGKNFLEGLKKFPKARSIHEEKMESRFKKFNDGSFVFNLKKRVFGNYGNNQNIENDDTTIIAASSGTGFFVSTSGHMVTNNHVIDSCDMIKAHYKGRELNVDVLFNDRTNDLAIIKANIKPNKVFAVSNEDVSLLEDIIVAGYPLGKNISASIKTFKGSVTSLAGFGDNYSNFQIDASLSSGNSGGPIINQKGNVVGVAVEKLVEVGVEGFNFGVKSSTLKTFASSNQFKFQDPSTEELSNKELGQLITEATIYLECWMSVAKIKQIIEEGERQKAFFSEYK